MGARKRVGRFLKAYGPGSNVIGMYASRTLQVDDLEKLIQDSRELRQVLSDFRELEVENEKLNERITQLEHEAAQELPELDTEPLEGIEIETDAVKVLQRHLDLMDGPEAQVHISQQIAWQLLHRAKQRPGAYGITRAPDGTEWEWITKSELTARARRIDELQAQVVELANRVGRRDIEITKLRLKLRDKVAPEVNGKGPDGASRVQRWVETYRSHNNIGPGAIRSTVIKEEALTITLYVNDIEATLRQLNEARALADKHKRAAEKLQQLADVPEHFAASITKALSQLLTDPDE